MNILALHGHLQTGEIFRTKLESLVLKFPTYRWHFPDGPISLDDEQQQVPRRSWWQPTRGGKLDSFFPMFSNFFAI